MTSPAAIEQRASIIRRRFSNRPPAVTTTEDPLSFLMNSHIFYLIDPSLF